jgi:hypothetical protein
MRLPELSAVKLSARVLARASRAAAALLAVAPAALSGSSSLPGPVPLSTSAITACV